MKYFINLILIRSVSIMIGSKYQNKKWRNEQKWYKNGKSNECETFQKKLLEKIILKFR